MSYQNILVTGGAGYIGSHACKILKKNGFNPIALDNLSNGHKEAVLFGPFEFGDVQDRDFLCKVFQKYKPVAVMHFAAFIYVGESVEDPEKYYQNNVFATLNLLNVMREFAVKNIIFSSTCAVYGTPDILPVSEKTSTNPINPYGRSKLFAEKILQDFQSAYGINFIALRYFNACGASVDGEIGARHNPETHIIPIVIKAALGETDSITINGDDYQTKDGTCIRDYVHVEDLAEAHLKALNFLLQKKQIFSIGEIFNIGIGRGFSVKEIIDVVKKVSGKEFIVKVGPRREGDAAEIMADNSKIKNVLGWQPKHTSLEEMVKTAYDWYLNGTKD
jgi:UDP-glucose-4-epimerase GalE